MASGIGYDNARHGDQTLSAFSFNSKEYGPIVADLLAAPRDSMRATIS